MREPAETLPPGPGHVRRAKGVKSVRLSEGIVKSIHLGHRKSKAASYLHGFMHLAETVQI